MRDFDLVVFDESDRVQKTLDHFFMPETSFDHYIRESGDDCGAYMKLSSKTRGKISLYSVIMKCSCRV